MTSKWRQWRRRQNGAVDVDMASMTSTSTLRQWRRHCVNDANIASMTLTLTYGVDDADITLMWMTSPWRQDGHAVDDVMDAMLCRRHWRHVVIDAMLTSLTPCQRQCHQCHVDVDVINGDTYTDFPCFLHNLAETAWTHRIKKERKKENLPDSQLRLTITIGTHAHSAKLCVLTWNACVLLDVMRMCCGCWLVSTFQYIQWGQI